MNILEGVINGRYEIIQLIGKGGMAHVYLVKDLRLERRCAMKIMLKEAFAEEDLERINKRFRIEAKTLALLDHPNIVKIYDFDTVDDSPYLIMEYIEGGTLKQKMGKPIPYNQAAAILAPVADGLNYAHEQGVLHRDIKPANILLRKNGQPVITDFGIAKILSPDQKSSTLTRTNTSLGTPDYMSPEQCAGKKIDGRADEYSLGMILFELCSGIKPYTGPSLYEIMQKQICSPVPKLDDYIVDVPEVLSGVINKALAKNPDDRYQTLADFAGILREMSRHKDVKPPVPVSANSGRSADKNVARVEKNRSDPDPKNRKLICLLVAILVLLLGIIGLLVFRMFRNIDRDPVLTSALAGNPQRFTDTGLRAAEEGTEPLELSTQEMPSDLEMVDGRFFFPTVTPVSGSYPAVSAIPEQSEPSKNTEPVVPAITSEDEYDEPVVNSESASAVIAIPAQDEPSGPVMTMTPDITVSDFSTQKQQDVLPEDPMLFPTQTLPADAYTPIPVFPKKSDMSALDTSKPGNEMTFSGSEQALAAVSNAGSDQVSEMPVPVIPIPMEIEIPEPTVNPAALLQSGQIINFGTFNNEPIEWLVLDRLPGNRILLLTVDFVAVDCYNFNASIMADWAGSSLRHWLNYDFMNEAFPDNSPERAVLLRTDQENGINYDDMDNPAKQTPNTDDYVFLLSVPEYRQYRNIIDSYDLKNYTSIDDFNEYGKREYWLRSQGLDNTRGATSLYTLQGTYTVGYYVSTNNTTGITLSGGSEISKLRGVRPAIVVDMDGLGGLL